MRFDITICNQNGHEIASSLAYNSNHSEFVIAYDDKTIISYNSNDKSQKSEPIQIETYITSISYIVSIGGKSFDLAATCTDGSLRFFRKKGEGGGFVFEKKVEAHEGAALCLKCNMDGLSLATSGEDGTVKIWSKSGNLRTLLASYNQPIYAIAWGGKDDESLLIAHGNKLTVLHTQIQEKVNEWEGQRKGHGVILSLDWNKSNNLIISGGEDCCYRVFNELGVLLYVSSRCTGAITSLAWNPRGQAFAVGTFNMIILCNQHGRKCSREKLSQGTISVMEWDTDGTQLIGLCASGNALVASLIGYTMEFGTVTATLVDKNTITVTNHADEEHFVEDAHFKSPIIDFGLSSNKLVVSTSKRCHVCSLSNLHNPIIIEQKNPICKVIISIYNFALISRQHGLNIYNMEGKYLSSLMFQGMQTHLITQDTVTLSSDIAAFIDHTDKNSIKLFHCSTGKQFSDSKSTIIHHMEIKTISISQGNYKNQHNQRSLVFIDCQDDLYISLLLSSHEIAQGPSIQKLSKNVKSVAWNPSCDILVAIKDSQMITWYYPNAPFVDKDLLILASETKSIAQKGVFSQIKSFSCSIVHICNDNNGLSIELYVTPFAQIIRNLIASYQWKEAIQVCHLAKNDALWAMLAGLAMEHSDLNTLEIAIRATKQVDKLHYIQYIKGIKNQNLRSAAMFLFKKRPNEAISILLQAHPSLLYYAVKTYIRLFKWHKALDISRNDEKLIRIVLWYRKKYLINFGKNEDDKSFLKLNEKFGELDDNEIKILKEQLRSID